jgi:hypothetical protein
MLSDRKGRKVKYFSVKFILSLFEFEFYALLKFTPVFSRSMRSQSDYETHPDQVPATWRGSSLPCKSYQHLQEGKNDFSVRVVQPRIRGYNTRGATRALEIYRLSIRATPRSGRL